MSSAAAPASTEFVQSLDRGLAVLRAFDRDRASLTLADAARATGLTRATARRLLHTLVAIGYVSTDGKRFELTPKVLDLGYAYVSSLHVSEIAHPYMENLSAQVHESVSAAVLDGGEIVYVARVNTQRIMTISLAIGSRLPALWTSMGRAILSGLSDDELDEFLENANIHPPTPRSLTDRPSLRAEIIAVRAQGFALLDQELEEGVRSVAAPLRDRNGRVLAAMNLSTHAGRVPLKRLRTEMVPLLLETAQQINLQLAKR